MYWILGLLIVIVLIYFFVIKPANEQIKIELETHREFTEKNKLNVSELISSGKYLTGFPQAEKVINKSAVFTNGENLILFSTKFDGFALGISSINVNKIKNLYIDNFHSMNERIIEYQILFNESYFVSLRDVEQNMPYYLVIEWLNSTKKNHAVFIFEGKDALILANRAVHELSELLKIEFFSGF